MPTSFPGEICQHDSDIGIGICQHDLDIVIGISQALMQSFQLQIVASPPLLSSKKKNLNLLKFCA